MRLAIGRFLAKRHLANMWPNTAIFSRIRLPVGRFMAKRHLAAFRALATEYGHNPEKMLRHRSFYGKTAPGQLLAFATKYGRIPENAIGRRAVSAKTTAGRYPAICDEIWLYPEAYVWP